MRNFVICFAALAMLFCQQVAADHVTGQVVDAQTGEPIEDAQIDILEWLHETTILKKSQSTDSLGHFIFAALGNGQMEIACPGYKPESRRYVAERDGNDTVNLGIIQLKPSEVMLKGVKVVARARKFVMRGDTVVFNPRAFELEQGARLEELIKRLPGVSVKEGKLYWNDRPLRILMNGEELFENAEQLTSSLPAEAVDKIKTYNKASDFARHTGRDDGGQDQVLDLQIKPGWLDRWYGDAEGTYQTPLKGAAEMLAYRLSTAKPLMVYANVNNTGDETFYRTFNSSSSSSGHFGRQQFGSLGYKHQFNAQQGNETLRRLVTLGLSMGHNDKWQDQENNFESAFPGQERTFRTQHLHYYKHELRPRLDVSIDYDADTLWQFALKAHAEYNRGDNRNDYRSAVFAGDPFALAGHPIDDLFAGTTTDSLRAMAVTRTQSLDQTRTEGSKLSVSGDAIHYLRHNGMLMLGGGMDYSDSRQQTFSHNDYRYYRDEALTRTNAQYDRSPGHTLNAQGTLTWQQWLGKQVLLSPSYRLNYTQSYNRRSIYYADADFTRHDFLALPTDSLLGLMDPRNSRDESYRRTGHVWAINMTVKAGPFTLMPTLSLERRLEHTDYHRGVVDTTARREANLFSPSMGVRFKPGKGKQLQLNASVQPILPQLEQTIGWRDDSDPLVVNEGNPALRRGRYYSASLAYNANITRNAHAFSTRLDWDKLERPQQPLYTYDAASGIYTTRMVNGRGGYSVEFSLRDELTLCNYYTIRNDVQAGTSRYYAMLTANVGEAHRRNCQQSWSVGYKPRFVYERSGLMAALLASFDYRHDDNSEDVSLGNSYWDIEVTARTSCKWGPWQLSTDLTDRYRHGYAIPAMDRHHWLWNASVSRKCLAGKGLIKLSMNDLLNQDKDYLGLVQPYERTSSWSSHRHHYASLSFRYHLDAKADKDKR